MHRIPICHDTTINVVCFSFVPVVDQSNPPLAFLFCQVFTKTALLIGHWMKWHHHYCYALSFFLFLLRISFFFFRFSFPKCWLIITKWFLSTCCRWIRNQINGERKNNIPSFPHSLNNITCFLSFLFSLWFFLDYTCYGASLLFANISLLLHPIAEFLNKHFFSFYTRQRYVLKTFSFFLNIYIYIYISWTSFDLNLKLLLYFSIIMFLFVCFLLLQ